MTTPYWIVGDHEEKTVRQLERCLERHAYAGLLCADGHLGYSMPVGGVVAYHDHVSPSGVGYDIGCGNKAVLTNVTTADLRPRGGINPVERIMDEIVRRISFGVGRVAGEPAEHEILDRIRNAEVPYQRGMLDLAAAQLGTVGAGNHFVDLLEDAQGRVWIGVHFGSRGFGHKTATHFLDLARHHGLGGEDGYDSPPTLFSVHGSLGQDYLAAMRLAGDYARAGRDIVCATVLDILKAKALDEVHNHHNYAWLEKHDGVEVWVVRKGATPAWPGQRGFVGGSMGDFSVIVRGVEHSMEGMLHSTVHGAGRRLTRTQAAGKRPRQRTVVVCNTRDCSWEMPASREYPACPDCGGKTAKLRRTEPSAGGIVDWPAWQEKLATSGIVLRGGAADEAPEAYKSLTDVLRFHEGSIVIEHWLRPIGVAMAGPDVRDPYKD